MRFKVTFTHPDIMPRLFIIGIQHHHSLIHVIHLIIVIWQKLDTNVLSIEESLMPFLHGLRFLFPFLLGVSSLSSVSSFEWVWFSLVDLEFFHYYHLQYELIYNPFHWQLGWDFPPVLLGKKGFIFRELSWTNLKLGWANHHFEIQNNYEQEIHALNITKTWRQMISFSLFSFFLS